VSKKQILVTTSFISDIKEIIGSARSEAVIIENIQLRPHCGHNSIGFNIVHLSLYQTRIKENIMNSKLLKTVGMVESWSDR